MKLKKFVEFLKRISGFGFLLMFISFMWCICDFTTHKGEYFELKYFLPIWLIGAFIYFFPYCVKEEYGGLD